MLILTSHDAIAVRSPSVWGMQLPLPCIQGETQPLGMGWMWLYNEAQQGKAAAGTQTWVIPAKRIHPSVVDTNPVAMKKMV